MLAQISLNCTQHIGIIIYGQDYGFCHGENTFVIRIKSLNYYELLPSMLAVLANILRIAVQMFPPRVKIQNEGHGWI